MADSDNVRVGVTGAIAYAPTGTALPTTVDEALNAAFADIGYVDENGVTERQNTSSNKIKAWQLGTVMRVVQTEHDLEYQFKMVETIDDVLEAYYGATDVITADALPHKSWVIDVVDGDEDLRLVVPDGQVTNRGEVKYSNGEPIGFDVTITCYEDASGNKAYMYRTEAAS